MTDRRSEKIIKTLLVVVLLAFALAGLVKIPETAARLRPDPFWDRQVYLARKDLKRKQWDLYRTEALLAAYQKSFEEQCPCERGSPNPPDVLTRPPLTRQALREAIEKADARRQHMRDVVLQTKETWERMQALRDRALNK
jgi:hypothetical protein